MKVAVLLSTYNGERYLRKQIDSILAQTDVELEIFARDDGSKDDTAVILAEYKSRYSGIFHFVNQNNIKNCGVKKSYLGLLSYVFNNYENHDYFSFADQDDFWGDKKLSAAVNMLESTPDNPKGKLYYSNKTIVNEKLETIVEENIHCYNDFIESIWGNFASGCTMVFDKNLARYALKRFPGIDCIHDDWVYRIANSIGSTVCFDKNSYMKYRQHEDNVVGFVGEKLHHDNIFYFIKRFIPVLFMKRTYKIHKFYCEIYRFYEDDISDEVKETLIDFVNYRKSLKSKMKLIFNKHMKKRPFKTRMIWAYMVLFNRR